MKKLILCMLTVCLLSGCTMLTKTGTTVNRIIKFKSQLYETEENYFNQLPLDLQLMYASSFEDVDNDWFKPIGASFHYSQKAVHPTRDYTGERTICIISHDESDLDILSKKYSKHLNEIYPIEKWVYDSLITSTPFETNKDPWIQEYVKESPTIFICDENDIILGVIQGVPEEEVFIEFVEMFYEENLQATVFRNLEHKEFLLPHQE